ncbi:hypothetical protein HPB51_026889 [Rhipicephalus microplus]|uniref:Uncharacterized protein n=1 Tax=Rhipicephalus microplus TaxID=6941 RepID=A0A9J6D205_RHIMP|nr:hypothetical protein HPB51_026889 [Rhipicephalus microplus]
MKSPERVAHISRVQLGARAIIVSAQHKTPWLEWHGRSTQHSSTRSTARFSYSYGNGVTSAPCSIPCEGCPGSIGDRITSLHRHHSDTLTSTTKAGAVGGAVESSLTDDSVITEDDAMSRVNREPGDTSSEPSTSQQNELAFQGDIYTPMRRNRRQLERLQKSRETREKFLAGGSASSGGSEFGWKRRGFQRRSSSILASKKNRGSGRVARKNESLQAFRGIRGTGQRGRRSPPPKVRVLSESHTDTDSVASTSSVGQAPVASTTPLKKLEQPFMAAKSPGRSALRKRKSSRRRDMRGEPVTSLEKSAPVATVDAASVVFDRPRPATESSSATSSLWRKEPVATDKCPEPSSQVKSDAKKDASKRRKPKGERKRKKMKDKSKTTHACRCRARQSRGRRQDLNAHARRDKTARKQRSARKREERAAEAKPSESTQAVVGPSSEALEISAAASGRTSSVNKRRSKKHTTAKSPASAAIETSSGAHLASTKDVERESTRAASTDNVDRVFDEEVAVHNHPHHRRQRRSKSKKHAKKGDGKRQSRNTKKDVAVASATVATGGELLPASTTDNYGYGGPFKVDGADAVTTLFKKPSLVAAPSQPFYALPPTADVTLTGTDTALLPGGQRHAPRLSTVINGDDVTVHLDLTSRDRAAMFWPFGRRRKKKRQPELP